MGLDIYFEKKDFVDLDLDYGGKDRDLFDYINIKVLTGYREAKYLGRVKLKKSEIRKILKYMYKHNENNVYNKLIFELNKALEDNTDIYFSASW